jgi:hypothetical protein
MNTWVEPPPPKTGMGCFAKGCLILAVFVVLLGIAGFAGIYWGTHSQSALARGIVWLTKIHAISETPAPVPEFKASDAEIEAVRERWQKFEETARAGQPAEIELTANDINRLIVENRDLAGKVFVSIEGSRLGLKVSFPLREFIGRAGHYFNADIVMQADGAQSVDHLQLNRITVNNEPVPGDLLDWKLRSRRLRDYLFEHAAAYRTGSFEIQDGKLVLRSRPD